MRATATQRASRTVAFVDTAVRPVTDAGPFGGKVPAAVFCEVILYNLPILIFCELWQKKVRSFLVRAGRELIELLQMLEDIDTTENLVEVLVRDHLLGFVRLAQF